MPAQMSDKITSVRNATRPVSARVTAPRSGGATNLDCDDLSGWPTDSKVHFVTYQVDANGATVPGTQLDCAGIVSGNSIVTLQVIDGSDIGNEINDVVEMLPTAAWGQDLADALRAEHDPEGKHTNITANTITATGTITADEFIQTGGTGSEGWSVGIPAPTTVVANGNRSYTLTFDDTDLTDTLSPGMRLRTTRTVAAPTQCTKLNGTTQYWNKTSPTGLTATDDIVAGGWVYLDSYGVNSVIISRWSTGGGWMLRAGSAGNVEFIGGNGSGANTRRILSLMKIPLKQWVFVAAQLDMSSYATVSPTASFITMNGSFTPGIMSQTGTNPTSFSLTGNLEVGSFNGGTDSFSGKIGQAFVTSAKLTLADIQEIYSQGLTASIISSKNIVSAYSFDGVATDLNTTNANDLTAQGSATATEADSPFGNQADGSISSTLDYGIATKVELNGSDTEVTVQCPWGNTIPTSGGVSAVQYSSVKAPYGMPIEKSRYAVRHDLYSANSASGWANGAWHYSNIATPYVTVPCGEWTLSAHLNCRSAETAGSYIGAGAGLSTGISGSPTESDTVTTTALTTGTIESYLHLPRAIKTIESPQVFYLGYFLNGNGSSSGTLGFMQGTSIINFELNYV